MKTKFDQELNDLNLRAKRDQERINLLTRLRNLELEEQGVVSASEKPHQKRGRKPNSEKTRIAKKDQVEGKRVSLKTLLEQIGRQVKKPLTIKDFVTMTYQEGYKTKSKKFSNVVYQNLNHLVNAGTFKRNENENAEKAEYEYVEQQVA